MWGLAYLEKGCGCLQDMSGGDERESPRCEPFVWGGVHRKRSERVNQEMQYASGEWKMCVSIARTWAAAK